MVNPDCLPPTWARPVLLVVGLHSLIWWRGIGNTLTHPISRLGELGYYFATFAGPALCSVLLAYVCIRPERSYRLPLKDTPWRIVGILAAIPISVTIVATFGTKVWILPVDNVKGLVIYVFLSPLFEELLFRGVVFELAERALPGPRLRSLAFTIALSSLLFGLAHWQYHEFALSEGAVSDIAIAFAGGVVFGSLRALTGSLWPGLLLHSLLNLIGCLR